MRITVKNTRISFPNLFKPTSINGSDPKYNAGFLIDPSTTSGKKEIAMIEEKMQEVANQKWNNKPPKGLKFFLHDGDDKEYAGYAGMKFFNASNSARPTVVDGTKQNEVLTEADGRIYAGCYVNVIIDIWAQDNSFGKRINASLAGVQFIKDGEAFTGGVPASVNDFDALPEENDPLMG